MLQLNWLGPFILEVDAYAELYLNKKMILYNLFVVLNVSVHRACITCLLCLTWVSVHMLFYFSSPAGLGS